MIVWTPGISLEEMERKIIEKAFEFYNKNPQTTANSLKIDINEFYKKKRRYEEISKQNEISKNAKQKVEDDFKLRARGITTIETISPIIKEYSKFEFPAEELSSNINKRQYSRK